MIELAPNSGKSLRYVDAILYCQFLNHNGHIDWRMPTREEYQNTGEIWGWFVERNRPEYTKHNSDEKYRVVPVRDIVVL